MKRKFKVKLVDNNTNTYEVIEYVTTHGERTSAYDSEPNTTVINKVYKGSLADCDAYIRLHERGCMI